MALVPSEAIVLLLPEINTRLKVFAHVGFEALQADNPALELFVIVWKVDPDNPFCVVFGLPKGAIEEKGWPPIVDREKRWAVVRPISNEELRGPANQ